MISWPISPARATTSWRIAPAGAMISLRDGLTAARAGSGRRPRRGSKRRSARRPTRSQTLLAAFFIGAGVNHFVIPRAYRRIVPPSLGHEAGRLVAVSGLAEIAGGVGVLLPPVRRPAGVGLIALLVAVFPANIYMARTPERFRRIPRWALYGRLPLQPLMMWWAWRATRQ
jgi:uncharacterized membrane protein